MKPQLGNHACVVLLLVCVAVLCPLGCLTQSGVGSPVIVCLLLLYSQHVSFAISKYSAATLRACLLSIFNVKLLLLLAISDAGVCLCLCWQAIKVHVESEKSLLADSINSGPVAELQVKYMQLCAALTPLLRCS